MIIKETSFEKIKKQIQENKEKEIIFSSCAISQDDDELNRKILEKLPINVLLLNQRDRKDFQKQRNSGFNQVLAKIAKSNKIKIGINLDEIIEEKSLKTKAEILARISQNIKLCNKNRIQIKFISQKKENERNVYDLKALAKVLGARTELTKNL